MDFSWNPEEQAFREGIRQFLQDNLPDDWRETVGDTEGEERDDFEREFARKMGERKYLTVGWPAEYGGLGWSPMQQFIFNLEMALVKAPRSFMGPGVYQVGASIIMNGTEEQKREFLPPITRGEVRWCTLFSEPNAGSDLASLQVSAVEDGDDFVVNGQKIWNSGAHKAEHGILLARTDPEAPKHKGIGYFLVDMDWPGITVQPIMNMADVHSFNSVFFDNVRVPKSRMVGEKNRGWYVGTSALNVERSGVRYHVPLQQYFEEIVDFVKAASLEGGYSPLAHSSTLRHKLADTACQVETSLLLSYRVAWLQSSEEPFSYESSLSKLYAAELTQRVVGLGMEVLGLYGQLEPGPRALLHGKAQKLYRAQRAITIGAGTSEIQRTVIARRGLGLGQAQ